MKKYVDILSKNMKNTDIIFEYGYNCEYDYEK